mmetsp:Transcript_15740/g.35838  ORF Transcript_15740/g.35838 Transcript_15740/m.35838 type:complete len:251 (+) Transcript_15740:3829-4581(+)
MQRLMVIIGTRRPRATRPARHGTNHLSLWDVAATHAFSDQIRTRRMVHARIIAAILLDTWAGHAAPKPARHWAEVLDALVAVARTIGSQLSAGDPQFVLQGRIILAPNGQCSCRCRSCGADRATPDPARHRAIHFRIKPGKPTTVLRCNVRAGHAQFGDCCIAVVSAIDRNLRAGLATSKPAGDWAIPVSKQIVFTRLVRRELGATQRFELKDLRVVVRTTTTHLTCDRTIDRCPLGHRAAAASCGVAAA